MYNIAIYPYSQRWCDCDRRRGGMRCLCIPISLPWVSRYQGVGSWTRDDGRGGVWRWVCALRWKHKTLIGLCWRTPMLCPWWRWWTEARLWGWKSKTGLWSDLSAHMRFLLEGLAQELCTFRLFLSFTIGLEIGWRSYWREAHGLTFIFGSILFDWWILCEKCGK